MYALMICAAVAASFLAACGSKSQTTPRSDPTPRALSSSYEGERRSPVEPLTEAHYAKLFVQDACVRYRVVHREQSWVGDGPPTRDESQTVEIRCCVADVRRFGAAVAARTKCTWPRGWSESEFAGNPPITPIIPAARVYVSMPGGLWWAEDLPASDADAKRIANDPQKQLLALAGQVLSYKNTEDEDVSYTATVERDDQGRWCWQRTERADYTITETLCFSNGTMIHSLRRHDLGDDVDITTLDLID